MHSGGNTALQYLCILTCRHIEKISTTVNQNDSVVYHNLTSH
jgi:hypothetical protein